MAQNMAVAPIANLSFKKQHGFKKKKKFNCFPSCPERKAYPYHIFHREAAERKLICITHSLEIIHAVMTLRVIFFFLNLLLL